MASDFVTCAVLLLYRPAASPVIDLVVLLAALGAAAFITRAARPLR